jgi:cephalosporin-C deacetylase
VRCSACSGSLGHYVAAGGSSKDPPASREEIESFWRATLQRAAKEPLEAEVEPVKEPLPYRKFRVTYRSLGNIKVRACLGVPIRGEGPERPLPCIVTAPGYGGSQQGVMLDDCHRGYAVLQVYPRSQGESADLWKIDGPDKLTWRADQPEGYYYQGAYVDVIRGMITCCQNRHRRWSGSHGTVRGSIAGGRALDSRSRRLLLTCLFCVICGVRLSFQVPW